MLSDRSGNVIVSSLGWVDHASLWVFRATHGTAERVPLGNAKYLSIHAGIGDFFSVTHHFEGDRVEITVHTFSEPREAVARARFNSNGSEVTGDSSVWSNVQTNYITHYSGQFWSDFCLVRVHVLEKRVELQQFGWYGDQYDKGYQGVVGVVETPRQDLLIVSIQRDSHPVLYDPVTRTKVGTLNLADRMGNPKLFFRRGANELWANDYDTLVKIEPGSWRVLKSRLLQKDIEGARQFIGEFWFDADETMCVVARPFSRDVLALSPHTLRSKFRCKLDGQPVEAVCLRDGSIVARDWKSGSLLRGQLRRAWST
jgi:hypothetical protein